MYLQPLVLKQEIFLAYRPQQEKVSVDVITGDEIATTNGVHSVNSRTELSANPVTPQPTQTMVMTVPAKDKSDSSIAEVLVNEYASNGDKQSKNSYGSEASVTGKKVDVFFGLEISKCEQLSFLNIPEDLWVCQEYPQTFTNPAWLFGCCLMLRKL